MRLLREPVLLFMLVWEITGTVVLSTRKETSIECASNVELTFKFISRQSNKSLTIAECDIMMGSCRFLETALENKYNLSYTGRGGILHITSLDEDSIGTYTCCETYNPRNFVSTDIMYENMNMNELINSSDVVAKNSTANYSDETRTDDAFNIWTIILLACAILVIIAISVVVIIKKNKFRVCKKTQKSYQLNLPRSQREDTSTRMADEESDLIDFPEAEHESKLNCATAEVKENQSHTGQVEKGEPLLSDLNMHTSDEEEPTTMTRTEDNPIDLSEKTNSEETAYVDLSEKDSKMKIPQRDTKEEIGTVIYQMQRIWKELDTLDITLHEEERVDYRGNAQHTFAMLIKAMALITQEAEEILEEINTGMDAITKESIGEDDHDAFDCVQTIQHETDHEQKKGTYNTMITLSDDRKYSTGLVQSHTVVISVC